MTNGRGDAIIDNDGQESACGWCKDKWGVTWQITPRAPTKALADPDPAVAKRVFEAMMQMVKMVKIDIAAIAAARGGDSIRYHSSRMPCCVDPRAHPLVSTQAVEYSLVP